MFGKLCKYEFKSIVRTLGPIYLAVIAISVLNAFLIRGALISKPGVGLKLIDLLQLIFAIVYFGVLIAMSVLTLIVVIQRFYKGLLCDEGYLMFTLPVKPRQLIAAKGLTAFVMSVVSALTAFLSIYILTVGVMSFAEFIEFLNSVLMWSGFGFWLDQVPNKSILVLEMVILLIVGGIDNLFHMYLSMALGHLSSKHRVMMSVVAYIAISILLYFINGILSMILEGTSLHYTFISSIIYNIIRIALFFFCTEHILSKRLNLE